MTRTRRNVPPYFDLRRCLDVTRQIHDKSGEAIVRSSLAGLMKSTEKSSTFIMGVAALKSFGLVTVDREKLELTSLARSICRPIEPGEERDSIVSAFLEVEEYRKICDLFKGGLLPEQAYMSARIERELNLGRAEAELWVESFLASAETAGIFELSGGRKVIPYTYADKTSETRLVGKTLPMNDVETSEAGTNVKPLGSVFPARVDVRPEEYRVQVLGNSLFIVIPENIQLEDLDYLETVVTGWIKKIRGKKNVREVKTKNGE